MSHQSYTKDESFLLALYEEALKTGDVESPIDRYIIGSKAAIQERGVNAICKLLIQANFIKKASEDSVYITPHGIKLVQKLLLQ